MATSIQAWDYVVLALILFISICIGSYQGLKPYLTKLYQRIFSNRIQNQNDQSEQNNNDNDDKLVAETTKNDLADNKQKTTDYLIATSSMSTIPVALSLLATFYSATSMLGFPAEIYQYGIQYWLAFVGQSSSPIFGALVTVPFLASLNVLSVFEYFEMRYGGSKYVRLVGMTCYLIRNMISCSIFMYGPATALALLANFDQRICIGLIGLIGTFYTTIGGIRGVIWNDLFQALIMFASLIIVIVKGKIECHREKKLFVPK